MGFRRGSVESMDDDPRVMFLGGHEGAPQSGVDTRRPGTRVGPISDKVLK